MWLILVAIVVLVGEVAVIFALDSGRLFPLRASVDSAWLRYRDYAIDRDEEARTKKLAVNRSRWEECKAIEEEAWTRYYHEWSEEHRVTVRAGAEEFTSFMGCPAFRKYRAILITSDESQRFIPHLPPSVI